MSTVAVIAVTRVVPNVVNNALGMPDTMQILCWLKMLKPSLKCRSGFRPTPAWFPNRLGNRPNVINNAVGG